MLAGRICLITGSTRGIGLATARAFSSEGAKVIISSRRLQAAESIAAEIRASGGHAAALSVHVGRPETFEQFIKDAASAFVCDEDPTPRIDVLVNNAAVNPHYGPLESASLAQFDFVFHANVRGPLLLSSAALPYLKNSGSAAVINVSSIAAATPAPHLGLYATSKGALDSLTKSMAREWAPHGITANCVAPGLVATDFSSALWKSGPQSRAVRMIRARSARGEATQEAPAAVAGADENGAKTPSDAAAVAAPVPPEGLADALHRQCIKRLGTPDDIVGTMMWLASDKARFVTGSVIAVDGGYAA